MEKGLYGFIWRFSKGYQLIILCVTIASFPLLYYALELPKIIVNDALGSKPGSTPFPRNYLGFEFDQQEYLLALCALFLMLLLVNGAITMSLFIFKGITSERLLRRLRFLLFERIHLFPLTHFQKTSQGEVTSMITAEVEPFSQFFADAIELPLFQGGTMLTVLFFVFVQDPIMGLASIAVIPLQAFIIPKLQKKINLLAKERVVRIRGVAGRISEAVSGINDIHTHDTSAFSLADFTHHLSGIFKVRLRIYQNKAFLKFINNFLLKLTPLLFYSVGGILILEGNLDLGQLVAVLGAYSQLMNPWKELLRYYQRMMDAKIKYQQVTEQFDPADMIPGKLLLTDHPEIIPTLAEEVSLRNVSIADEDGVKSLDSITFDAAPGSRIALVAGGSGRDSLGHLLTRLIKPTQGRISVGSHDLTNMHESVIGRRVGYAGPDSYIFDGTIGYNVFYGLKHQPVTPPKDNDPQRIKDRKDAIAAGNSSHDIDADWVNYADAGVSDRDELFAWWHRALVAVEMEDFMYGRAMNMIIDPDRKPMLADNVVRARRRVQERIQLDTTLSDLIHPFDFEKYNVSATVGANLIFGEAVDEKFSINKLGNNEFVRDVLDDCELTDRFEEIGLQVAATLLDMFDGMSSDDPIFEQYSFVDDDSLQELKRIVALAKREGSATLMDDDRSQLISLTFQLVVERHRLGHIDDEMQLRILEARRKFRERLPEEYQKGVSYFDPEQFNARLPLRSNLIMGRVNAGRPQAEEKVDQILFDVLNELELTTEFILAAADFDVGIGGRRVPLVARQSIALLRSIVKRPEIMVINEALNAHDRATRNRIRGRIFELLPDTTIVWIDSEMPEANEFDQILVVRNGRIEERISDEAAIADEEQIVADSGTILNAEISALSQVPIFSEMDASQLKLLAFTSERLTYDQGQVLFVQGDIGDAAYVILDGSVDIIIGEGEEERVVNRLEENELVGDMALLSTKPRSATVRAATGITVLELKKELFLELLEGSPHVAAHIARVMSDRLYNMTEQFQVAA
ncbi:MAG: putative ABC transporter ATP-binding protein [Alphaproteobacteria bacterium MarineAlpha4_Bin2]|nr:MAG: putative ABC transporter ATP-binding protein [Alphaproteobacteria bacterium MarineAlpha4_Bin2]